MSSNTPKLRLSQNAKTSPGRDGTRLASNTRPISIDSIDLAPI